MTKPPQEPTDAEAALARVQDACEFSPDGPFVRIETIREAIEGDRPWYPPIPL